MTRLSSRLKAWSWPSWGFPCVAIFPLLILRATLALLLFHGVWQFYTRKRYIVYSPGLFRMAIGALFNITNLFLSLRESLLLSLFSAGCWLSSKDYCSFFFFTVLGIVWERKMIRGNYIFCNFFLTIVDKSQFWVWNKRFRNFSNHFTIYACKSLKSSVYQLK